MTIKSSIITALAVAGILAAASSARASTITITTPVFPQSSATFWTSCTYIFKPVFTDAGHTLTYQWAYNGANISGATASSLAFTSIPGVTAGTSYPLKCTASTSGATAVSSSVTVNTVATPTGAFTNYLDGFARTGVLNGSAPNVDPYGATWLSDASFTTVNPPGTCTNIAAGNDESYLSFTPVNGHVYILSCTLNPPLNSHWEAFGYSIGTSLTGPDVTQNGTWLLCGNSASARSSQMFTGPQANLGVTLVPCDPTGPTSYAIILDTTTTGSWKASFYEDGACVNGPNTFSSGVPAFNGVFIENYQGNGNTWANLKLTDSVLPNEAPVFLPNVQATAFVMPGGTLSLSCGASDIGSLPITYQWQFNGTNLTNNARISGALTNTLIIANAQSSDGGSYQVIATDSAGSVTSAVCVVTVGTLPVTFTGVDGQAWTMDSLGGNYATNTPLINNLLTLTDGNSSEVREFWFNFPQSISGAFQASFTYQSMGSSPGEGATFCIQNDSRGLLADTGAGNTLGVDGQGYTPNVSPSVELAFYTYTYMGATGYSWSTNGSLAMPLSTSPVSLTSQDPIAVTLNYTNQQLTLTLVDTVTSATFSTNIATGNIAALLGTNNAYVGFTGSDGSIVSVQTITNFTFVPYNQPLFAISYTAAQNVYAGNTAQFTVVPSQSGTSNQWFFVSRGVTNILSDGSGITGSQSNTLTIANISSLAVGYYQCVITNATGTNVSPLAPLTIVTATGSVINGPNDSISDCNNPAGSSPAGAGPAEVEDGTLACYINYGPSGGPGNAFVGPVGFIDTPLAGASILNAMRIYEGTAYTAEPADYAIYGGPGPSGPWTLIAGGSLDTFTATNSGYGQINSTNDVMAEVDFANTNAYASYAVYFTNIVDDTTLNGLQVAEVQLLGALAPLPPGIVQQPPAAQNVWQGQCLVASVQVNGPPPFTYQWYSNSVANPIAGQTNATLSICGLQPTNTAAYAAAYFAIVNNAYGSITSSPAAFTFIPTITGMPSAVVPGGLAVNTHFVSNSTNDFNMIEAGGWQFIRTDVLWSIIEGTKGVYDFSLYDQMMLGMKQHGLRLLGILDYANGNYGAPGTADFNTGYANFAAAAAAHYAGQGVVWEMWNEPNDTYSWSPSAPNPTQYVAMVSAAVPGMRAADPTAPIISGGVGLNTSFQTTCFQLGLLNLVDAVAVHPYLTPPENMISACASLRSLMLQYHATALPIVSSEWGWTRTDSGITAQVQGDYMARMYLINLMQGVPISSYFDWMNDGTDPNVGEDNFGTVNTSYVPYTAYYEMQLLTASLQGLSYAGRLSSGSSDYLLAFTSSNKEVVAAWTTRSSHSVTVLGKSVSISSTPVYVTTESLSLVSSFNPSTYGGPVTFTATVSAPGTAPTGTVTFQNGATVLGTATLSGGVATLTTSSLSAAGSPNTITAAYGGDSNYGAQNTTLGQTVNPATLTYVATAASQPYGSANTVFTGNVTGFVGGDTQASATTGTLAFASTTTATSPVGSYAITGSGLSAGNYTFVQAGGNGTALTITQAGLSITASPQSKTYGAALSLGTSAFTANGLQNGETVGAVTLTASGSPAGTAANAAAGPYTITPSAATGGSGTETNYNITYYTGTLTVNPLAVVLTGTEPYNGTTNTAPAILSVLNVVGSDDVSVAAGSAGMASANIGTNAITSVANLALGGATAPNYTLNGAGGSVIVTPLAVTLTGTRPYDGTNDADSSILTIVTNYDGANLTLSGSAILAGSGAGSQNITDFTGLALGGTAATNYTVANASGSVTVTGVALSITANPVSKTYGTALTLDPTAFTVGSGLVGSETATAVTMSASGGTAATDPVSGSPYAITPSAATGTDGFLAANYNITYNTNSLTVNPLAVVLTGTRPYDGTATAAATILSVSDAVGSDDVYAASGSATLASASVGVQPITDPSGLILSGITAPNYTVTGATGSVTITSPNTAFSITASSLDVTGTNFVVCWQSVPGVVYNVLTNASVALQSWAPAVSIAATNTTTCFTLPGGTTANTSVFVVIQQQ